MGKYVYSKD